jgi:tRNA U34 5-carboxymethylaminomethyl modifying GTPase MnmE/TrmE
MPTLRRITGPGKSALAVVEVRGADSASFLQSLGARTLPQQGGLHLATLDLGHRLREQALLVSTPEGYEIQTHGNPLLVDAILALGRDSENAPESIKSDDWESRIMHIAREAAGPHALRLALFQLDEDGLLGWLRRLSKDREAKTCLEVLEASLRLASLARRTVSTPRVVLRGRVNAGKSTLFNLLLGQERARTGPMPALTRDPVQEQILYRDLSLILVDTAGEAEDLGDLDDLANRRSQREASTADLVVWLHSQEDGGAAPSVEEGTLVVETHHPCPNLENLQLDLLRMQPREIRSQLLERILISLRLDSVAPLKPAPLDERMEEQVRWLLHQDDPVAAAVSLVGLREAKGTNS